MEYEYKNLKSNKMIKIDIKKPYSLIYGPNGTGKTTFARFLNSKKEKVINGKKIKYLVFDQDFVNNNIYISTVDKGYKTDPQNKSKLKQIFLGDSSKDDNEKLNLIRKKKREFNKQNVNFLLFKNDFKNIVEKLLEDESYDKENNKFIMNYIDDNLAKKYIEKILKNIENKELKVDFEKLEDDKYIDELMLPNIEVTYNTEEIKEEIIKFLNDEKNNEEKSINSAIDNLTRKFKKILNTEVIEKEITIIDGMIKSLDVEKEEATLIGKLELEEKDFLEEITQKNEKEVKKIQNWIKDGHEYHKELDFKKCLYCRNDIKKEIKDKYKSIISNKYMLILKNFKKEIEKIYDIFNDLNSEYLNIEKNNWFELTKRLEERKVYRILLKRGEKTYNIIKNLTEKGEYSDLIVKELCKLNEFLKYISKKNLLKTLIDKENNEINKNYKGYQLFLQSSIFQRQLKVEMIKKQLLLEESNLTTKIIKDTEEYINKIKDYIGDFEKIYEPRLKLKINANISKKDSAESTIEIETQEKDFLNQLSEGEKNVLSLIIFFSYVKKIINTLEENESIVMVLDDPVNSNDWNNFFKFKSIIEDYFYFDVMNKKISNIIILTHNIDYAIIQLQSDKLLEHFELLRLFCTDCKEIDTKFLFMNDIKLGSKLLCDLLSNVMEEEEKIYINKKALLRVAIYMRKFLESFLFNIVSISNPNLIGDEKNCFKFLKNNTNSDSIKELIDISTNIMKDLKKGTISVDDYMKKLLKALADIVSNYNLFKEDAFLNLLINKYKDSSKIFSIKDSKNQYIVADEFEIEENEEYRDVLIDILIKGLIVNLKINEKETVDRTKKSARIYYLNYLRHVNDNVGRPVLAVNSDAIIE